MILINSSPKDALRIFQPFSITYVPIGIGCLVSVAEKQGIKVHVIDEQVEDDILGLVQSYVKEMEKPYIFGFSVLTVGLQNALLLAKRLKALYPDSVIIFGGIHPSAMPEEVLGYACVDIVIRGEAERALFELYSCIKNGNDYGGLHNLSYKRDGKVVHNKADYVVTHDLVDLPFPYHIFRSKKYDYGFVMSARGCPYQCIFCSNRVTTGRRYSFRSPEIIVDELQLLYDTYHIRHVQFLDDNFLVNKERIYVLLDYMRKKDLHEKMTFNFQSRGDNVDRELLKSLYAAGFKNVFFGLETASERLMKVVKKGETVAQCIDAVKLAKEIGFHVSATFIYGLPGETHQDRMDCVRLCKELQLDMVRFNNATPYPGTELYKIAQEQKRLYVKGLYENFISVSTFIENPFKKIPFTYVPEGNIEEDIRSDIILSYFSYYLDFNRIKNIFTKPEQSQGWFNAGEELREVLRKIPALLFLGVMLCFKLCQLFYFVIKRYMRKCLGKDVGRIPTTV